MTPAALAALAKGDLSNFAVAATPGGIEAQERSGQIRDSLRETLPKEMYNCTKADFETLGFKFTGETEGIFWTCEFPKGWRKKPTEHSMWSKLLDDKGRERSSIFFKAAFYDFHAHVDLERRYRVKREYGNKVITCCAFDYATDKCLFGPFTSAAASNEDKLDYQRCLDWLNSNFPNHQSPLAYWSND